MKLAWFLVLVLGCKGDKVAPPSVPAPVAGSGSSDTMKPWQTIEALAVPVVARGSTKDLERALALAQEHVEAWRAHRGKRPATPLADYSGGTEAIAALEAWVAAEGGLPPIAIPFDVGPFAVAARDIGELAIETSTPDHDTAKLAVHLGVTFVQQARNLLEAQVGLSVLAHAKRARNEPIAVDVDLVRVVAADALFSRRMAAYLQTREGRQRFDESIAKLGPEAKGMVEGTGTKVEELFPDQARSAALEAFWLVALDGARRGEDAAVSIARLRKAATAADPAIQNLVQHIPIVVEGMQRQRDEVASDRAPL